LLLERGVEFYGRSPIDSDQAFDQWRRRNRPRPKQCYYNAQSFVIDTQGATYYEGYCVLGSIPVPHAWAVLPDGSVVDFTLDALDRAEQKAKRKGLPGDDTIYLGLSVPNEVILERMRVTRSADQVGPMHYTAES
jgi:hypothetical protein